MTESNNVFVPERNVSPNAPGSPPSGVFRRMYKFITSAKFVIALLLTILVCCAIGVTIFRGDRADVLIFRAIWFNILLVLLAVSTIFCFSGRIWGKKLTLITFGMVLFHLSFVVMLGGNIYNNLCYFKGAMRLTEGETLPNGDSKSYDTISKGRFFSYSRLKGETTFIKMHKGYIVNGVDKKVAYEIAVGEKTAKKKGFIFIINDFSYNGFEFIPDKEGYSVLVLTYDNKGNEIFGVYVPIQSLEQKNGTYLYTTGTKDAPGAILFPQSPLNPLFGLQFVYRPKGEQAGDVFFQVWPITKPDAVSKQEQKPFAEGKAAIGEMFRAGDYSIEVRQVRYWVSMNVLYNPGHPIIFTGFWAGLGGMMVTAYGRIMRGRHAQDIPS